MLEKVIPSPNLINLPCYVYNVNKRICNRSLLFELKFCIAMLRYIIVFHFLDIIKYSSVILIANPKVDTLWNTR